MTNENFALGIKAAKAGNLAEASAYLARVVQAEPRNLEAWLMLGHCLSDPEKRRTCYSKVLALDPANALAREALKQLGRAEPVNQPVPAPAAAPLPPGKKVRKPLRLGSLVLLGVLVGLACLLVPLGLLQATGQLDGLIQRLGGRPAVPDEPGAVQVFPVNLSQADQVDALTRSALDLMSKKSYAEAIQDWDQVIQLSPQNAMAYYQRAVCRYTPLGTEHSESAYMEALSLALTDIDQAIVLQPAEPKFWHQRTLILADTAYMQPTRADRNAVFALAIENNRYALTLDTTLSQHQLLTIGLGEDLIDSDHCDEGLQVMKKFEQETAATDFIMGTILYVESKGYACLGEFDRAIQAVTDSTFNNHILDTKAYYKALYLYEAGRLDEAFQVIDQNIAKRPSFMGYRYFLRAAIYYDRGELDLARQDLDIGQMYTWDRTDLYCYLNARLALDSGHTAEGIEWLQKAEDSFISSEDPIRQKVIQQLADLAAEPNPAPRSFFVPTLAFPIPTSTAPR